MWLYPISGNIIFTDGVQSAQELSGMLEETILKDFGLPIKVMIRTLDEIKTIMDNCLLTGRMTKA